MNKRRLTRQQAWRVEKIQEERLRRAERKATRSDSDDDHLGPEQQGLVVACHGPVVSVENTDGSEVRCRLRQNLGVTVPGDQVVWQAGRDGNGVVTAIMPRRTTLARPDALGNAKPLAANVDQIVIVAAPLPRYDTHLIDHYLVAAEALGIEPLILLNKIDLLDDQARRDAMADLAPYTAIGYRVVEASTREGHGLDRLLAELTKRSSVFVGQSGVGKSSLVRALLPDSEARVGDLHSAGQGRHTTSTARLYHLPCGGDVIDSPGVREFQLWTMDRDALAQGFRELRNFLGQCRFRDCRHLAEPGCALTAALEQGAISANRLASFRRLAEEMAGREKDYG